MNRIPSIRLNPYVSKKRITSLDTAHEHSCAFPIQERLIPYYISKLGQNDTEPKIDGVDDMQNCFEYLKNALLLNRTSK